MFMCGYVNILGSTALHHACTAQSRKMVNFLIANNCNVSIKDIDGNTAIQLADDETMIEFIQAVLFHEEEKGQGVHHVKQFHKVLLLFKYE